MSKTKWICGIKVLGWEYIHCVAKPGHKGRHDWDYCCEVILEDMNDIRSRKTRAGAEIKEYLQDCKTFAPAAYDKILKHLAKQERQYQRTAVKSK